MKRVVINLAHRTDRRHEMETQLSGIGWTSEFFEAVRPENAGGFPSIGARGCFESHLAVLRSAGNSDLILIEDDLDFVQNFPQQWEAALKALPDDWSIFYPAHGFGQTRPVSPGETIVGAHMIVFRASVIPIFVRGLETILARDPGHPLGGPMHVDGAYNTIRAQNPDIKTYGLSSPLGYQRSSRSDISGPSWIDAYPRAAALVRPIKSFLKSRFGLLRMTSFRSFLALPFHCVGVLLLGLGLVFLGIGAGIDTHEEPDGPLAGPTSLRKWPFSQ